MSPKQWMIQFGFDMPRLGFSLRTALAACLALLVAWAIGLEHPQWSAMTVWAAAQPTRGQLLEKGFFRALGTLIGVAVGVGLVAFSGGHPAPLVIGLSIWIGICVAAGNLLRGYVSYGAMLSGYSASMVALLDSGHPDHVLSLGADRAATIMVGVATAVVIGWLLTPATAEQEMTGRMRRVTARLLRDLALGLKTGTAAPLGDEQQALLAEMAAIDELLDPHGAGSRRSRQTVRAMRTVLSVQVSLLLAGRRGAHPHDEAVAALLDSAASGFEGGGSADAPLAAIDQAADHAGLESELGAALQSLSQAIRTHRVALGQDVQAPANTSASAGYPIVLHRDWIGARQAAIRATACMLAVGFLWVVTGWASAPYLLLGLSIMTTIFSTFENPAQTMRYVLLGQVLGSAGALLCRFVAWPLAGNELEVVLLTLPFILVGPLFFSHRRTLPTAFDYAMVSLLLLHPVYPLTGDLPSMLSSIVALLMAPLIALVAYKAIFPLDAGKRLDMLIVMMVHELQDMARAEDASQHRLTWRARLYHRLLRLIRYAERSGGTHREVTEGGLAVLSVGRSILMLQDLVRSGAMAPGAERAARAALQRLKQVRSAPEKAASAMARAAERLAAAHSREAGQLAGAAEALQANGAFLQRAR
ncbi:MULTISPECIES: FUSC family protein [Alphaproteobacteria]|uniref:Fusaric acid resistance protein n=2 Tax=Alphaproteobacteria TaxID=28211 RepID=A0A512HJ38_9HYPH|nr:MULTISPECIES: FUSC family protein [Alphaproteobacteria]GEO85466.1 fusaric acid resistance protein [Ciceribacter naphthalenivorans]GLR21512.1 fusaric acid resistance protein [Ciceribacter naphthalenivorans]GLT04368.1 fusaric acid resistance protein [Sphingomonas psychrolutea]